MKILIIGGGGREHALATAYSNSKNVTRVIVAPGNDFMEETSSKIRIAPKVQVFDFAAIIELARKERVDLVDVAQDDPLAAGLVDELAKAGIPAFGPTRKEAELEWNKVWARNFMQKYNLPSPAYYEFTGEKKAVAFIQEQPEKLWYIKASGLAAGKGAIRAETKEQALQAIKKMRTFGSAGDQFLIEEGMIGEEFSLFAICDGKSYTVAGVAQDHKTVFNSDQGANTGGMGCVAPSSVLTPEQLTRIKKEILNPLIYGMQQEDRPYTGILYLGGMLTHSANSGQAGVKIVEFNARWGDPEAEVILPSLKTDYSSLMQAVLMQELRAASIQKDTHVRISIAGCAKNYPDDYTAVKNKKIFGLTQAMQEEGIMIFGAGIKRHGKNYVVNGGRIFHLVAEGATIADARKRAYAAMSLISIEGNNLHYRTDIGWREAERHNG